MSIASVNAASDAARAAGAKKTTLGQMDQGDFLKLMTVQMQHQDPFDPVDNKEMLAQMAQFSQLAGTSEMGATLKSIAEKLDAVLAAREATAPATSETTADPAGQTQEI